MALRRWIVFVVTMCLCASCNITRKTPQGSYFLQKVTIESDKSTPRDERVTTSSMERYVRQMPNKRLLGLNIAPWFYLQANPQKSNWWNRFKRDKVGKEPVMFNMAETERSLLNLKIFLDSKGFLSSMTTFEVDTTSRSKRAYVTYRVVQNLPYRIDTVSYIFHDKFLEQLILPDTSQSLVKPGEIFDITILDAERARITDFLKDRGYYNFTVNNIEYIADTLSTDRTVGLKMVVKQNLTGYDSHGEPELENNRVYRINQINIFPNYDPIVARSDPDYTKRLDTIYYRGLNVIYEGKPNLRPRILRQAVPLYPNYVYNIKQVNRTYSDLMALGYFRSTKVSFSEQPRDESASYVTYIGDSADSTKINYTRESYLQCDVHCTPSLKQSFKVDLEGSTTTSFYGLKARVGYQNRNIFRGAESFDLSFTAGYEYMKADAVRTRHATEFGGSTGLSFPRFLLPFRTRLFRKVIMPKTKLEFSINLQDRPYYRRTLSSVNLTYSWSGKGYSSYSLRPIDINVVNMGYLNEAFLEGSQNEYLNASFISQFMAGLSMGYTYNNQRKNLSGNATVLRINVETVGNLVDGLAHLFSTPRSGEDFYRAFGLRYAQYVRTSLDVSRKIMIGGKVALVGRLYGGVVISYGNADGTPMDRLFYAGGSNGMRGWAPRTLGPGDRLAVESDYPMRVADLKLEANLELRFPIWGIVHGATFLDAGNIWMLKSKPSEYTNAAVFYPKTFYQQLGFNTGVGLRLDIKFAVLRLDWGIQLHNPNNPMGERWIHNFKWGNTALNFGVGYPF